MTDSKTAILIGATGLVGSFALKQLLNNDRYSKVKVFHRRPTGVEHSRLEEHIIDFEQIQDWQHLITGDHLYSAMGTTIKKAGSQEAQYTVDFTYPFEVAKAAAQNGVSKYALVSSAGADAEARAFYPRLKGELDLAVKDLSFDTIVILRPSILLGNRDEDRFWEDIGIKAARIFCKLPGLKKYRPIPAETVAAAMIQGLQKCIPGYHIIELDEVFYL